VLRSFVHAVDLLAHRHVEVIGAELLQRVTRTSEMIGERLRQSLVECRMLHVDYHRTDAGFLYPIGDSMGFLLGWLMAHGDVARPIRQKDHQGYQIFILVLFFLENFMCHKQSGRERSFTANRDVCERRLGELDGVRRFQHDNGAVFLEDDQADAISALVGVREQGQDRTLGCGHPLRHGHGPGGVDDEQNQVCGFANAYFFLKIGGFDGKTSMFCL